MPAKKKTRSAKTKVARPPKDAVALLKADHSKVEGLFGQFEKARDDKRKLTLARDICTELKIHTEIEEEIFYPAAYEALPKDEDMLDEAEVEHASAKELIAQIEAGEPGDELWDAKVKVLSEYIKHHVKEEQNEMFPKVKKTKLDLVELGTQLQQRKDQLMTQMGKES